MLFLDEHQLRERLAWTPLIDALHTMFIEGCVAPERHHYQTQPAPESSVLLVMPAWQQGRSIGVKIVNVHPGNGARGLPAIAGIYALFDGKTGQPSAILDGAELTARRTAAVSALAARHLARRDARQHLVVGTGKLSLNLIEAHRHTSPIDRTMVWGRSADKAEEVARQARALGLDAVAVTGLEDAVRHADIVSCATLSQAPLVLGRWLRPGVHVDLVGAFRPSMRETDDEVMRRADLIVADTRAGVLQEAGDIVQAIAQRAISADPLACELPDLVQRRHPGRTSAQQITVFKSVGMAASDLAAAVLAVAPGPGR